MTDPELAPPRERECERCGRRDVWDDDGPGWRIADSDGGTGDPFCIHEWNVDGSYHLFEPEPAGTGPH